MFRFFLGKFLGLVVLIICGLIFVWNLEEEKWPWLTFGFSLSVLHFKVWIMDFFPSSIFVFPCFSVHVDRLPSEEVGFLADCGVLGGLSILFFFFFLWLGRKFVDRLVGWCNIEVFLYCIDCFVDFLLYSMPLSNVNRFFLAGNIGVWRN